MVAIALMEIRPLAGNTSPNRNRQYLLCIWTMTCDNIRLMDEERLEDDWIQSLGDQLGKRVEFLFNSAVEKKWNVRKKLRWALAWTEQIDIYQRNGMKIFSQMINLVGSAVYEKAIAEEWKFNFPLTSKSSFHFQHSKYL